MKAAALQTVALWLAAMVPAVALAQAYAPPVVTRTTRTAPSAIEPDSDRIARFLAGADWRKSTPQPGKPLPPGQEASPRAPPPEPTWWQTWRKSLAKGLLAVGPDQPPSHPLLRQMPLVLATDDREPNRSAVALPWSRLACPTLVPGDLALARRGAAKAGGVVALHLLQVSDEGQHVVGVDLACVQGRTLVRMARLVAVTDSQGRVVTVGGLVLDGPWPLTAMPGPEATVSWPLAPAGLNGQQPAISVLATGGWLVQAERAEAAEWLEPGGRQAVESGHLEPKDPPRPRRVLLRLDGRGMPMASLVAAAAQGDAGVAPLPMEGAWEADFGNAHLLLQRTGRMAPVPGSPLPAVVDAGYLAWRLESAKATPVPVPLPRLAREGAWDCQADVEPPRLTCRFVAPPGPGTTVPADMELLWSGKGFVVGAPR